MKLRTALIATILICSWNITQAQDASSPQQSDDQLKSDQPAQVEEDKDSAVQGNEIISEPSGAERPSDPQKAPGQQDTPPGRAFDQDNPPQGRPFREGQQVDEPAGAEQQPKEDPAKDVSEPAGAQPGQSQQLSDALGKIKGQTGAAAEQNMELKQAIKTSIKGTTQVPDEFIDRLSRDLSVTLNTVQINQETRMQLANSLHTVLNAQPGSATQIDQALNTIQTTLIQNGVTRPSARAVVCDLHLIATELVPDLKISVPTK